MNEPAVFEKGTFPPDVRFDYDGHPASHTKAHNIYGMQMARATNDGVKRFSYPNRPFTITRSTYSGGQRYSSGWTGDNIASWEHLWLANIQCQRLSISGFSFIGSDIGGFIDTPTGELYARWIALGAFHPFFRTHSSGDHGDQEPWSFGDEMTDLVRALHRAALPPAALRVHRLLAVRHPAGTPMLRPLTFLDQNDTETYLRMAEFGLGDHLLICPITTPGADGRWMYLPRGDWFYYWTDALTAGGSEVWAAADLTRIPLFMKAGAVLPMQPVLQYVGEKAGRGTDPARVLQKRHRRKRALRRRRRGLRLPAEGHRKPAPLHRGTARPPGLVSPRPSRATTRPATPPTAWCCTACPAPSPPPPTARRRK